MRVVICGGGVIGACTAYYLSLKGARPLVVERTGVAHAASGKSGGFLARDWCRGSALDGLARRSFDLHASLAEELAAEQDLDWGYHRVDTWSVTAGADDDEGAGAGPSPRRAADQPGWLGPAASVHGRIGSPETTAQIDPARFTHAMMTAAGALGGQVRTGTVEGVILSDDGRRATGVRVDGESVAGDAVVIAMGPWSILACRWLPLPGVFGLKGHSLVFRFAPSPPAALFGELLTEDGVETPEVFPRADGTTYVCGLSGEAPLPVDPARVEVEEGAPERLRRIARRIAPDLGDAEVLSSQACYRPVTRDGLPVIGAVPGVAGAWVATGHSVWGMLNGPATGEALAGLIVDGASPHVDLAPFDPARMPAFDLDGADAG